MTPSVSPEADRELTEAGIFYAREGGKELGLAFIAEFARSLDFLCLNPLIGPSWRNDKRRFPIRRFPYSIIYDIRDNELRVVAIAHHRQKPDYWSDRI
jgi:plasmid stabilization system protein ParE